MKYSVGKKMGAGFGAMFVLIIALGITCFISLQDVKTKIAEIHEARIRSDLATSSVLEQRNAIAAIRGLFAYGEDKYALQAEQGFKRTVEAQEQLLALTPLDKKVELEDLLAMSRQQRDFTLTVSLPLARTMIRERASGNMEGVRAMQGQLSEMNTVQVPIAAEIARATDGIKAYNEQQMHNSMEDAIEVANRVIMTAVGFSVIAAIVGIILGIGITKKIRDPLTIMLVETRKFASGDWRNPIPVTATDEIGELADALNIMRDNTHKLIKSLNDSVERVSTSEDALRQANEGLEVKVEERTQELFALNEELSVMNEELQSTNQGMQKEFTVRMQAEQRLRQKNEELGKAYEELRSAQSQVIQQEKMASIGQLAAGVAHEINNPMGFIISNLASLRGYTGKIATFLTTQEETVTELSRVYEDESGSTKTTELLSRLKEAKRSLKIDYIIHDTKDLIKETLDGADRIKNIVQDLKGFARIANENKSANINDGIESTINILCNEIKYKAVLMTELGDIPLTKCNLGQLNQVFMNLLMNAVQSIDNQGEIRVKTWTVANRIFVSIADTGCGIPPGILNRIFEPFYTTKEVGKGTGLGLSVTYDIIKKHDGEIQVESEVGQGTKFTVIIPVVEERGTI